MPAPAVIAMGGNLGNVPETFERAIEALGKLPETHIISRSGNYLTQAVGTRAGGDFVNAAVLLETEIPPQELLEELHRIEAALGRVRTIHWGPRTLDLDLVRYGDEVRGQESGNRKDSKADEIPELHTPRTLALSIPHPACWCRRFVLDPWSEIDAEWIHPLLGESVNEMRNRLRERPLPVEIVGSSADILALTEAVLSQFPASVVGIHQVGAGQRSVAPAIRFYSQPDRGAEELPQGTITNLPRGILATGASAAETVLQVLRGALDEPRPL